MPKVLGLVSFRIYPTLMGGQKGVALFYSFLQRYAEVLLAVSSDNEKGTDVNTESILFTNKKIYFNITRLKKLQQLVHDQKIDLIIAEHSYSAWMAYWLHRRTGRPFIIHSHNIESKRFREMNKWWWRFYQLYESWIHRRSDHNFFISEEDRRFAISSFHLDPVKCSVITYGTGEQPFVNNKTELKIKLGFDPDETILLFNGTLDYKPNYDAVVSLIEKIEPGLSEKLSDFKIVITGNRAPEALLEKMNKAENIVYAGYVTDVNEYYQSADLFLNPVVNDTGVKTKLIEAIANHCTAISTISGASGLVKEICGNKLVTVEDQDWDRFIDTIIALQKRTNNETPTSFYDHYNWKNIAEKASQKINELVHS